MCGREVHAVARQAKRGFHDARPRQSAVLAPQRILTRTRTFAGTKGPPYAGAFRDPDADKPGYEAYFSLKLGEGLESP